MVPTYSTYTAQHTVTIKWLPYKNGYRMTGEHMVRTYNTSSTTYVFQYFIQSQREVMATVRYWYGYGTRFFQKIDVESKAGSTTNLQYSKIHRFLGSF